MFVMNPDPIFKAVEIMSNPNTKSCTGSGRRNCTRTFVITARVPSDPHNLLAHLAVGNHVDPAGICCRPRTSQKGVATLGGVTATRHWAPAAEHRPLPLSKVATQLLEKFRLIQIRHFHAPCYSLSLEVSFQ
jgi:hypothetical protein